MDETQLLAIREEAAILYNIDHPYVVRFIGLALSTRDAGCGPMLVMEYLKGGNLEQLLENSSRKLSWADRMRMLWTAALGLEALHTEFGIVHRDIKPSNLLVDKTNGSYALKIADFGFAALTHGNTTVATTQAGGTPLWTAPEFYAPATDHPSSTTMRPQITNKADVFSFAMVIWQVLTRKLPYADDHDGGDHQRNLHGVIEAILANRRPSIPSDCPPDLAALIKKCWHRNPAKRPDMTAVSMFFGSMVGMSEP
jgi:serine/threonine protein kinase